MPTAQTLLDETALTPNRSLCSVFAFGVATVVQLPPSKCCASVLSKLLALTWMPTDQTSLPVIAAVPSRMLWPAPVGLPTASNCPSHEKVSAVVGDRVPIAGALTGRDLAPECGPAGPGGEILPEADAGAGLANNAKRRTNAVVVARPSFRIRAPILYPIRTATARLSTGHSRLSTRLNGAIELRLHRQHSGFASRPRN